METPQQFKDWAEKFKQKNGRYPVGAEILRYWESHPQVYKEMCPNPARIDKPKVAGDSKPKKKTKRREERLL